ncbi:hypothetical protein [Desulfatiferula olefinivorans]
MGLLDHKGTGQHHIINIKGRSADLDPDKGARRQNQGCAAHRAVHGLPQGIHGKTNLTAKGQAAHG